MIPIIELKGTYQTIGQQFGENYKNQIKDFATSRMARLISFVKRYGKIDITESEVLTIAESLLPAHQHYDADLWQEFNGIATGANLSLPWLLVANAYTDLRDYICKVKGFNDLEVRFEGCSGFVLDKSMSAENNYIIGQTWDMSVEALEYLVIVKKTPISGPKSLYLTTMGALALIGLNSNKIAIGNTNLMANDCINGVNYLCTISKVLKQQDYQAALDCIINTPRMSGHSFLCASPTQANLLETSSQHLVNYAVDHYPLIKTNNYSEEMRQYEIFIPEQRRRNSLYRYGRVLSLLTEQAKWTRKELWQILADECRSGSGAAICNEDYNGQYSEFATLATVLLIPELKTLHICKGGAANGVEQIVTLD